LQELRSAIPARVDVDARRLLGRFLFTGDDADKRVGVLSGGERTRLALAKMLVSPVNLMCMDEPTNHLDMWSRDVLEDALQEYSGCIVLITHDRHLIRSVANRIVEVIDGKVTSYPGDYEYYLSKKEPEEAAATPSVARPSKERVTGPKTKDKKRAEAEERARTKTLRDRVARIEREVEKLGAELAELEVMFASPDLYMAGGDVAAMTKKYDEGKKRLARLETAWAEAMESLDSRSQAG
jgi:ATP-binding cassette subfamily F protein 3